MAQDHFKTPPDPKRSYKNNPKSQKNHKVRAKPAKIHKRKVDNWSVGSGAATKNAAHKYCKLNSRGFA